MKTQLKPRLNRGRFAEKLGGRLAMQGAAWGAVSRIVSNEHFFDQLSNPHNIMKASAVVGLVSLGTLVTRESQEDSYFSWTPEAEILNGRLAMAGLTAAMIFNI